MQEAATATTTDVILHITYLYLLILLFALLIERIMEVLMAIYGYIEYHANWNKCWEDRAKKLRARFEGSVLASKHSMGLSLSALLYLLREKLLDKKEGYSGKIPFFSAELVRQSVVGFVSRLVATAFGIVFCVLTHLNVVKIFNMDLKIEHLDKLPDWVTIGISGIILGLGSESVHTLIKGVEDRGRKKAAAARKNAPAASVRR